MKSQAMTSAASAANDEVNRPIPAPISRTFLPEIGPSACKICCQRIRSNSSKEVHFWAFHSVNLLGLAVEHHGLHRRFFRVSPPVGLLNGALDVRHSLRYGIKQRRMSHQMEYIRMVSRPAIVFGAVTAVTVLTVIGIHYSQEREKAVRILLA